MDRKLVFLPPGTPPKLTQHNVDRMARVQIITAIRVSGQHLSAESAHITEGPIHDGVHKGRGGNVVLHFGFTLEAIPTDGQLSATYAHTTQEVHHSRDQTISLRHSSPRWTEEEHDDEHQIEYAHVVLGNVDCVRIIGEYVEGHIGQRVVAHLHSFVHYGDHDGVEEQIAQVEQHAHSGLGVIVVPETNHARWILWQTIPSIRIVVVVLRAVW